MTPGLNNDIWCDVWPSSFLQLQITKEDIMPQVIWAVKLMTADGHFVFLGDLCGHVLVNILTLSLRGCFQKSVVDGVGGVDYSLHLYVCLVTVTALYFQHRK